MKRKAVLAGNWKMNLGPAQSLDFLKSWSNYSWTPGKAEMWLFPSTISIPSIQSNATLRTANFILGAQNCSSEPSGAFTGETSAKMLKDAKVPLVLIGHSERRSLFLETDAVLVKKARLAVQEDLHVLYCIGESLQERQSGKTLDVIFQQLDAVLTDETLKAQVGTTIDFAYEPVWAIGTGQVATPEIAQAVHHEARGRIRTRLGDESASKVRILYGGSVQPDNFASLLLQKDIDGGLVGGASLKADAWNKLWKIICETTEQG